MEPGYTIEPDIARRFVRITLYGFWNEATVQRYATDLSTMAATAAHLPGGGAGCRVLLDMRDHILLGKDEAESLQGAVRAPAPGQRTAVLVTSLGLLKRQVGRVASALQPHFFVDEDAAMAWLFAPDPAE